MVSWAYSSFAPNSNFLSENPQVGYYWKDNGTALNNFNWIIGVAPLSIPEPSTVTLLGSGLGLTIAFLAKRRNRTRRSRLAA